MQMQALELSYFPADLSEQERALLAQAVRETLDLAIHAHVLLRSLHDAPDDAIGQARDVIRVALSIEQYLNAFALSRMLPGGSA